MHSVLLAKLTSQIYKVESLKVEIILKYILVLNLYITTVSEILQLALFYCIHTQYPLC